MGGSWITHRSFANGQNIPTDSALFGYVSYVQILTSNPIFSIQMYADFIPPIVNNIFYSLNQLKSK